MSMLVKIKDYRIPKNGRLEFRDMVMDVSLFVKFLFPFIRI